ncbi:MAG: hypothetical protein MK179_13395 [Pirellulaceae bacterium]|nr:hypothetical protein [Pirellulaceae bacterium]
MRTEPRFSRRQVLMGGVRLGGETAGIAVAGMPLLAGSPTASTLPGGSGSRVQMERVETIYSDGQHM